MPKLICDKHSCARVRVGARYRCKACDREYQRANYAARAEVLRPRKAQWMAAARADPVKRVAILETQRRCWANGAGAKTKIANAKLRVLSPFVWRARLVRAKGISANATQLEELWIAQAGRCGITGRLITIEEADLDHVVPVSRGGTGDISNLRWTWSRANEAKGNMLDSEFLAMCSQIAEWIGRRILAHAGGV